MPIMPNGPKATRLLVPCLAALGEGIDKAWADPHGQPTPLALANLTAIKSLFIV